MYTDIFSQLGLTKNEAKIYETLLRQGETGVGKISTEAAINRRNVYDSLDRLIEKGLVFEIRQGSENLYQAVDPNKLMEAIKEKESALEKILPDLVKLHGGVPHSEDVYIYRGVEGWKNYMHEILKVGQDVYVIGGKGSWTDKRMGGFLQQFTKRAEEKEITFHILFDNEVKETKHPILRELPSSHKFLPKDFSAPAGIDIFGDHVVILSTPQFGVIDDSSFTVIVNKNIAEAFRIWFRLLWSMIPEK